jgi:hypothetical protein
MRKALVLILVIASAVVVIAIWSNFQRLAFQFSEYHLNLIVPIVSVSVSSVLAYITYLKWRDAKRMSEKPAMAELCRFLILPAKEKYFLPLIIERIRSPSLQDMKEKYKEFYLELFLLNLLLELRDEIPLKIFPLSFERTLQARFYSVLEKMNRKEEWDHKVEEFNRSCGELISRIDKIEGKLKELIGRYTEEVRGKYEAIEGMRGKYLDFQELLDKLVDESYAYYIRKKRNQSVEDLSWSYLGDLFNRIEEELSRDFEEITILRTKIAEYASSLSNLLEDVRKYLEKEYKLTLFEQSLQITS